MESPTPPSPKSRFWRKAWSIFKKLTVAVAIGLAVEFSTKFLDVELWKTFSTKAEVFNTVMFENALVLNPLSILPPAWYRLKTNRYSVDILNLKAPFNLTQACQDRVLTFVPPTYKAELQNVPGFDFKIPKQDFVGSWVYKGSPLPYDCQLDEGAHPHQFWEYLLAVPDFFISMGRTAWGTLPAETITKMGRKYPVDVPLSARIAPWVRRGLLLLALIMALIQTIEPAKPGSDSSNFFPVALFQNLFVVSLGALLLVGVMTLVLWIGNKTIQITAATSALGTVGLVLKAYFDEAKALVLDTTKEKIGKRILGTPTDTKPGTIA